MKRDIFANILLPTVKQRRALWDLVIGSRHIYIYSPF